ncbi:MAG: 5-formyltetrahydrofolate cyclo-ligase [Rhodospirillales bacterium]
MIWKDVNLWRKQRRNELLARRMKRLLAERKQARDTVVRFLLSDVLIGREAGCIGFYWPFRGEMDLRELVGGLIAEGWQGALPVVVQEKQPVEFWAWTPDTKMVPGVWNIPVPGQCCPVTPDVLLVPLLGFDEEGYRLGYGGGYYDRTLASKPVKPLTVGVGFDVDCLDSIYPQAHDIPMDVIVTEEGVRWLAEKPFGSSEIVVNQDPASAPCLMHEADPAYMGCLTDDETVCLLNELLEAERAGARGVIGMARQTADLDLRVTLSSIAHDEARFCAMLYRNIERLGGVPSGETGVFLEKLTKARGRSAKLKLLNKGQGWVAQRLQTVLPKISDPVLYEDLSDMLEVHQRNVETCDRHVKRCA